MNDTTRFIPLDSLVFSFVPGDTVRDTVPVYVAVPVAPRFPWEVAAIVVLVAMCCVIVIAAWENAKEDRVERESRERAKR